MTAFGVKTSHYSIPTTRDYWEYHINVIVITLMIVVLLESVIELTEALVKLDTSD